MTKEEVMSVLETNKEKKITKLINELIKIGDKESFEYLLLCTDYLLKKFPKDSELLAQKGVLELLLGKREEADQHLYSAYRKNPKNSVILLALLNYYKNDFDKIEKLLLQCQLYNKNEDPLISNICNFKLGVLYIFSENKNKEKEGLLRLKKNGKLDSTSEFQKNLVLMLYYKLKSKHIKELEYYKKIENNLFVKHWMESITSYEKGNYKDTINNSIATINYWKQINNIEVARLCSSCLSFIYESLYEINKKEKNLLSNYDLEKILVEGSNYDSDNHSLELLGKFYLDQEKYDDALNIFETSINSQTRYSGESANEIGLYYHPKKGLKNNQKAVNYYNKAIDLGYYEAAINLGDFYESMDQRYYLHAIKMYKFAIENIKDRQLQERAFLKLENLRQKLNNEASKSFKFLLSLTKETSRETLYLKIKNWFDRKIDTQLTKIDLEIKNYFIIGIYNAVNLLLSYQDVDFSSSIMSISKGFELLLKGTILQGYQNFSKEGKNNAPIKIGKDPQYKTEPYFNYQTIFDIACIHKENGKLDFDSSKNYVLDCNFVDFVLTKFNISKRSVNHYINKTLKAIWEIRNIRNAATHSLALDINELTKFLDILFFEQKLVIKYMSKIK